MNDFIEYWTATKLLLQGGNPYSPAEMLAAQRNLGWSEPEPLMMWNPPWTLSFTLPFGLLGHENAQFVWFVSHVLILFLGSQVLWRVYGGSPEKKSYPLLAVVSFAPVYFALLMGQIGPLVLLGLVGFLCGVQRKTWSLAGASLALAAIKPHLVYLVWPVLLLWSIRAKNWRLAGGFAAAGLAVAVLPALLQTEIYANYLRLLQEGGATRPLDWATPALGTALAQLFSIEQGWIRWLPGLCGVIWLFWYWWQRSENWNWIAEAPLLLAVSIATTSFAWSFDHVVLLPAVIQGAHWLSAGEVGGREAKFIIVHVALATALIALKFFVRNDFWAFWAAPAYLLLYLYARGALTVSTAREKVLTR